MSRRWRSPKPRRGRFFEAPRTVAAPQPPPIVPAVLRRHSAGPLRPSRGRFTTTLCEQSAAPQRIRPRRLHVSVPRRGRFFVPPPLVVAAQPPPFPPRTLRARIRPALHRRGEFASPPWPSQAPPATPSWVPPAASADRPRLPRPRRGRLGFCPSTESTPARVRRRLLMPPAGRRGVLVEPPWPQAVPAAPPAFIPVLQRGRPARPMRRLQGRHWPGWMALTTAPAVSGPADLTTAAEPVGSLSAVSSPSPSLASGSVGQAALSSSSTSAVLTGGDA